MCGGRAARNSGLTSVTPSDCASCCTCWARCWIRCSRICSIITSCRMFSGNAARNDGSTPSGSTTSAQTNTNSPCTSVIKTNVQSNLTTGCVSAAWRPCCTELVLSYPRWWQLPRLDKSVVPGTCLPSMCPFPCEDLRQGSLDSQTGTHSAHSLLHSKHVVQLTHAPITLKLFSNK